MKIAEVQIRNFRAFEDETIRFGDYTCLVGPNGSGKSSVLTALNIFFRNTSSTPTDLLNLVEEDFNRRRTLSPVTITVTFADLDAEAQKEFADYYRQGKLIVSATAIWDANSGRAEVKQFGVRLGMKEFAPFFGALGAGKSATDLKESFSKVRGDIKDLPPAGTKQAMIDGLHNYETTHPDACVPLPSEDQFYGFTKGTNRLEKFIQWVFVPAVKDASTEQLEAKKTALGMLLERTVRAKVSFSEPIADLRKKAAEAYLKLLEENRVILEGLSGSLTARLKEWAHPDASLKLKWNDDLSKSISISEPIAKIIAGEGLFEGELARFGHGLQRSFLLALLQELSGSDQKGGPRLILACEEPELYQHPPQARHLASVLERLSTQNSQIIVSTHSPYFVSGRGFEDVRMFRKETKTNCARARALTLDDLSASIATARGEKPVGATGMGLKVHQALQSSIGEMFFASVLVLVEGTEDAAYITTHLMLLENWDDFRRFGCHIVPTASKSNIIRPLAIAKGLKIPTFVVFDSDSHKPDKNGSRVMHEADNKTILNLCGVPNPEPFPTDSLWKPDLVMWNSEIGQVVREDFGQDNWTKFQEQARKKYTICDVDGLEKNAPFIGYFLTEAWEAGCRSANLQRLCKAILSYAGSAKGQQPTIVHAGQVGQSK